MTTNRTRICQIKYCRNSNLVPSKTRSNFLNSRQELKRAKSLCDKTWNSGIEKRTSDTRNRTNPSKKFARGAQPSAMQRSQPVVATGQRTKLMAVDELPFSLFIPKFQSSYIDYVNYVDKLKGLCLFYMKFLLK